VLPPGENKWRVPTTFAAHPLIGELNAAANPQERKNKSEPAGPSKLPSPEPAGKFKVEIISAKGLHNADSIGKSDPYCLCEVGPIGNPRGMVKTETVQNSLEPCWNLTETFKACKVGDALNFIIKDRDQFEKDDTIAFAALSFEQFYTTGFYGAVQLCVTDEGEGSQAQEESDDELKRQVSKLERLRSNIEATEQMECGGPPRKSPAERFRALTHSQKDTTLDVIMVGIILLNSIVIGISMDHESVAFTVIDAVFTFSFCIELILKFKLHGVKGYFSSPYHCLDFALIFTDFFQLILAKFIKDSVAESTPPAAMFRVARLVRLVRLARLVQLDIFEDLIAMITGIVGGAQTLMWAIALFFLIVYVTALLFREFFGRQHKMVECFGHGDEAQCSGEYADIYYYFNNVPRAMLTIFRYFFGDFTTDQGINLLEAIQYSYGTLAGMFVCVLYFMIAIGVFNVIAAIFVERTMAAAYALTKSRKTGRMNDTILWSTRITCLIRKLIEHHFDKCPGEENQVGQNLSESLPAIAAVPVTEFEFSSFIKDEVVIEALDDLEIDAADHKYLFDILDNDNTGSIFISQLVDGVRRLRGDPRRSDIITIDLMVRAIQEQTNMLCEGMEETLNRLSKVLERVPPDDAPQKEKSGGRGSMPLRSNSSRNINSTSSTAN